MLNWIVWNRTDYMYKNGFSINNLQRLKFKRQFSAAFINHLCGHGIFQSRDSTRIIRTNVLIVNTTKLNICATFFLWRFFYNHQDLSTAQIPSILSYHPSVSVIAPGKYFWRYPIRNNNFIWISKGKKSLHLD